ncbi:hypothetical protein PFICI_08622 [Pestalotiopsis fici W106-1]|uniref:RNA polymerase I-specific transcription initiation factor RRN6-like protein n=1 Tax=Pestalotiopsis fici (strain W106-1 / CGMCC3.15140) TaxID=1229662 RepID=W3WYC4_PESFW|nr:uncharacterized protein PFICI_08622 [Pestalotiopsis fici W106-1]ETS78769.1 hypothetical protein PFICI_08622 [Pestalotiopsis fici W106-1]
MADRRYNESLIGNPGRLEYHPLDVRQAEDQGWLSVRKHEANEPQIRELGSHQEWPASTFHTVPPVIPQGTWHENRRQKQWLLKNHPEAALGNDELRDILADESPSSNRPHMPPWELTQFAIGEMTDTINGQKPVGVPLIAMATGSAGDVLRFTRPAAKQWHLDSNGTVGSLLEPDKYQETLWSKDVGTIRRIQTVVNTKRFEPVRWVVVQRESVTSVFRPEYQRVPVVSETFSGTGPQYPSHIAPNLLFKISYRDTGCNPHCDAAFNPGIKSKRPQLAIIDEGGEWTVWDISGTRNRTYKHPRTRLSVCGNIRAGIHPRPSVVPTTLPQWHRIFWVGGPDPNYEDYADDDASAFQSTSKFPPLERSSILLLCNQKSLRLMNLEKNEFLPDVQFFSDSSKDAILDVQVDPQDRRYFYVATTSRIFVVTVNASNDPTSQAIAEEASIIHSFPHLRSKLDKKLKLMITSEPLSKPDRNALVVLYSEHSNWQDVFSIRFPREPAGTISCHHGYLVTQDVRPSFHGGGLQTFALSRISHSNEQSIAGNIAPMKSSSNTCYFQMFSFRADLSLSYCLGVSTTNKWDQKTMTVQRVPEVDYTDASAKELGKATKLDRLSRQDIERQRAVRYLSTRFILADSIAVFRYRGDNSVTAKRAARRTWKPAMVRRMIQPVHAAFSEMLAKLWAEGTEDVEALDGFGEAPFDPVFILVQEAMETRTLARVALSDIVKDFRVPEDYKEASREWEAEIDQFRQVDPSLQISLLDRPLRFFSSDRTLEELFCTLVRITLGADPLELASDDTNGLNFIVLCRIACELYLARTGMTYLEPDILEPIKSQTADIRSSPPLMSDNTLVDGQDNYSSAFRSSSFAPGSQASSRASTPTSIIGSTVTETARTGNEGIGLIRALTNSGDVGTQRLRLPTPWDVGGDPSSTFFNVDNNTEITEGMRRRAKQEAREARKRKRAETLFRLQEEHNLLPSTQPVTRTGFSTQVSQPMTDFSSQPRFLSSTPAVAMSQPTAGAFGGRSMERPKKKPKRKGGF